MSEDYSVSETLVIFNILGIIMICCSTFVVCYFLLKKAPLLIQEAWKKDKKE